VQSFEVTEVFKIEVMILCVMAVKFYCRYSLQ